MVENSSFQSQLLSVMEVLAKAAVAEINRRVDDSCAVLRLEVSQSRRDIDLLKGKCEVIEAELRRSRMRARRRGERCSPWVKVVLNRERQRGTDWDRQVEAEVHDQPQQCADMGPVNEAQHIQIKEERAEDDNKAEEKLLPAAEQCFRAPQPAHPDSFVDRYLTTQSPADPQSLVTPADGYSALTEQLLGANQTGTELLVKHEKEEEPDENAAPLDSGHRFVAEGGDDHLWSSGLCGDAGDQSSSFTGQRFEQIPAVFSPQSGLHLEDMVPRTHSGGKSHPAMVNASWVKRRVRTLGCKRGQTEEGHSALSQINSMDQSSVPQQWQQQYRTNTPAVRSPGEEDALAPNPAASSSSSSSACGHGRGSFSLLRRMRTPWRSGIGEKRFSCTYCDKSFMRFSQLKEHLRSHTGEKPFSCLQCGRSFTKQCNLIRHAVVHSGEKPYECSLCGKCFTQRSSLKSHQKTAH